MSIEFSPGEVERLANDFVNEFEQTKLNDIFELMNTYEPGSYWYGKMYQAFCDEMTRLYNNDEDHELTRDNNDRYNKWINGGNPWD